MDIADIIAIPTPSEDPISTIEDPKVFKLSEGVREWHAVGNALCGVPWVDTLS